MDKKQPYPLLIFFLGIILFLPFLGQTHLFDWDEINFAECAREMLETGDYLRVYINYEPFWEKPPLFFWLQAGAMKLFGVGEFAARLPNAICGILSLLFLFHIGKKLISPEFGWLWSISYLAGILPHVYFKSGIIDPWFNLFIFAALYFWMVAQWEEKETNKHIVKRVDHKAIKSIEKLRESIPFGVQGVRGQNFSSLLIAGIFLGLAILTKGPVAYLLAGGSIVIYSLLNKIFTLKIIIQFICFSLIAGLTASLWFGAELISNGSWFIREFITYQIRLLNTADAGHKGFLGFHFVVLLIGCFPISIFAIKAFFKLEISNSKQAAFRKMMLVLFWLVLILFSLVQSKIIHYSSLAYYPLSFFAAFSVYHFYYKKEKIPCWIYGPLVIIGLLISLAFTALPYVGQNIEIIRPLLEKDIFAMGNIEAKVNWTIFDAAPGIILFTSIFLALYFFYKTKNKQAIYSLYFGTIFFVFLAYWRIVPNIEAYSQRAAVTFCKEKTKEDVHLMTYGYKSYTDLFYGAKKPPSGNAVGHEKLLLSDKLDKDLFLVCRVDRVKYLKKEFNLVEIGRENGFVFYKKGKSK